MATGTDLLELAGRHVGEEYRLGAVAPKNNAGWRGPWDCAELTSWCVFQVSRKLYGCDNNNGSPARADAFTGFWARDARAIGRKITVEEAIRTPGAALLRLATSSLIGHVVFSDGNGGTVEAKSRRTGVIRGTVSGRRWDMGVLVPWIDYAPGGGAVRFDPPPGIFMLTVPQMQGAAVRRIQQALRTKGVDPGPADGIFGPLTYQAVRAFQIIEGLKVDGEVGPETAEALGLDDLF